MKQQTLFVSTVGNDGTLPDAHAIRIVLSERQALELTQKITELLLRDTEIKHISFSLVGALQEGNKMPSARISNNGI